MSTSRLPDASEPASAVLDAFLEFMSLRARDGTADFDAFCRERPALDGELRRLHERWRKAPPTGEAEPAPRAAELRAVDPGHLLRSDLLARLMRRRDVGERYEVREEIARGGMGVIALAWDRDFRRRLAMKSTRRDVHVWSDRDQAAKFLARFLEEAQVTGQLEHPGIVPVHELGLDRDGSVFFTMRLVEGSDLRAIFDLAWRGEQGWSETRVAGVLLKVCEAMAYAHSKGVIHRDLKPGNIMVGPFGEVYVMDWGLARVSGRQDAHDLRVQSDGPARRSVNTERRELADATPGSPLVTMDGDVIGTPAYMPPEQARGAVETLSARSDIYAVGAMLYHLLARRMPYADDEGRASPSEILRRVLAGPPRAAAESNPAAAPELVAICDHAMVRDAAQRYPGMLEMAEDLRAYLEGRVVRAYETGAWAELRKWTRRNRALAIAGALALFAAIAGLVGVAYVQAQGRRNADREAAKAKFEAATSQEVTDLLTAMFEKADPKHARGADITVQEVLDGAAERMKTELADRPELRARLMHTMARVYKSLELYPQAEQLLEETLAVRRAALGDEHADTQAAIEGLTHLYLLTLEDQRALPYADELVGIRKKAYGDDDARTLHAMAELATVYERLGRDADAERLDRAVLDAQQRVLGPDAADTLATLGNLAVFYYSRERYEESRNLMEELLAARLRAFGPQAEQTWATQSDLAAVDQKLGRLDEAERLFREVLEKRTLRDRADHPKTLSAAVALGQCLGALQRWDEAERLLRPTLADCRRVLGKQSATRQALYHLARVLAARGEQDEARSLARELLEITPANDAFKDAYSTLAEQLEPNSGKESSDDDR